MKHFLTVIKISLLPHKGSVGVLRSGSVEDVAFGILGIETLGPKTLEVDRVRQNQVGVLRDAVNRQKVTDVTLGHVTDPIVDASPHLGGIRMEIGHLQLIVEEIEHALAQLLGVRDPKSVGHPVLVIRGSVYL